MNVPRTCCRHADHHLSPLHGLHHPQLTGTNPSVVVVVGCGGEDVVVVGGVWTPEPPSDQGAGRVRLRGMDGRSETGCAPDV